ncbi:hypothetical protein, partial [Streptococcus anginosus]|uniref:hypothetical protein n=1 Tax=Streptococcus anginosus TaxID=1328 RepID=UPI002ED866C3
VAYLLNQKYQIVHPEDPTHRSILFTNNSVHVFFPKTKLKSSASTSTYIPEFDLEEGEDIPEILIPPPQYSFEEIITRMD